MNELSEQEVRELEEYGDGVEVGINMLLRDLVRAYQAAGAGTHGLVALYDVCRHYGVDLDAPVSDIGKRWQS